jgi:hypothetical protein
MSTLKVNEIEVISLEDMFNLSKEAQRSTLGGLFPVMSQCYNENYHWWVWQGSIDAGGGTTWWGGSTDRICGDDGLWHNI